MFRVIAVVDKVGTALDRLAKGVAPYMNGIDYHVVDVHPKRPSPEQLARFESLARTADVIDYQYFRTADMLRQKFDWVKAIPSILTHNNPYSIKERDWNDYQVNVGNNRTIFKDLQEITATRVEYIPIVVDPYQWLYNENFADNSTVIMVANRIESKKGVLPVAKACQKLGIKMHLVGAISQPDYFQEVIDTGVVHFSQEVSDDDLRKLYYESSLHVCNSIDNFESGTMPILESMFCGVPVLTRKIGHVPDIIVEDTVQKQKVVTNMFINEGDSEDVDNLVDLITDAFSDRNRLQRVRQEAWLSIKDRNFDRRAFAYKKLYRELALSEPVTVILPVADKPEVTRETLNAIANQTHQNLEIIVVDDGQEDQALTIKDFASTVNLSVQYIRLSGKGYNLAKARNIAAIEATSDILVFCDQRMIMEPDCIEQFLAQRKPNTWLYGNKGAKKDFVENLSCIYRDDFMKFGMFNERMVRYGGLSQETRSRARKQGINIEYVEMAKATPKGKSSNRNTKRYEIMEMKNVLWKVGLQ